MEMKRKTPLQAKALLKFYSGMWELPLMRFCLFDIEDFVTS